MTIKCTPPFFPVYTCILALLLAGQQLQAAPLFVGEDCATAVPVTAGTYTAPEPDYWYVFNVPTSGTYEITTCGFGNVCDTKIYLYSYCDGLVPSELAEGTLGYNDDYCDFLARLLANLNAGDEIYIRIGDAETDCVGESIEWALNYIGEPAGCTDPYACNYNPLAMVNDGSCIYPGNPDCPTGPDLVLDETYFDGDIGAGWGSDFQIGTIDADAAYNECYIEEGSLTGSGMRTIIKFGIKIWNLGDEDYHIGTAAENPFLVFDPCHGHNHYIDYGEYLLYDSLGNEIPVGHKNGFAVMDLCGMGGYTGADMGISSGCYDVYGLGTGGQWIDITDVPDGTYTFVARVNWTNHPDVDGRVETNLSNNWRSRCINIWRDVDGVINAEMVDDCPTFIDCLGEIWGTAKYDCEGNCNGWHDLGDVNLDTTRQHDDVGIYVEEILDNTIIADICNDANNDSHIDVVDAALVMGCANEALGFSHDADLCSLPIELMNTSDTVTYSIGAINPMFNYLDIYSLNPSARVLATQFTMEGITIDSVANLCPETYASDFRLSYTDDEVIALGYDEIPYQVHFEPIPTFRIFYTATYPANICIKHFTAAVNDDFEEVVTALTDNCVLVEDPSDIQFYTTNPFQVMLQPNPFNTSAELTFDNPNGNAFTLVLTDINGNTISMQQTNGNRFTIEKGNLPAGIYMYKLTGSDASQSGKYVIY